MIRRLLQALMRRSQPVALTDLERTEPLSRRFGLERGTPIDRHYIDAFLARHADDIRGCVVEIGDDRYTRRFGSAGDIESRVLNAESAHHATALQGNLAEPESLPEGVADCLILTQTLNFIYDLDAALAGCARLLKPGGILLGSVAGITQISRHDAKRWGDYWRFTEQSLARLLAARFDARIDVHGNLLAARTLLDGLAVEDLPQPALLDVADPDYPVTLTFRAARKA
jgi:SAM-dependent methyltransferase